jgi:nitronate monooxygenase
MSTRQQIVNGLARGTRLPLIVAPMFLISGPALVIAAARAGVIGSFPAPNARTIEQLERWLEEIAQALTQDAPAWALNMIVHSTYARFEAEMALVERYQPRLVITALGSPKRVLERVHAYGGLVFADVNSVEHARKAVEAGVDGLILVASGAGGHTGTLSGFAFVREVRCFWDGPIVLSGAISDARGIRAAQVLGADLAYMGTRFIATPESLVADSYRTMLVESNISDVTTTRAVTGVLANWLAPSLRQAGFDLEKLDVPTKIDFSGDMHGASKAWKDVWGAGQGVGATTRIEPVAAIVDQLVCDYAEVIAEERSRNQWVDDAA